MEDGRVAVDGRRSKRLEGRPIRPLVVLSLVTLVDQIDTSILRGVLPLIEDDFDLADWQLGSLGFAFVFVNALTAIPAGWIADRVRRTRLIGFTLLSWSALSLLSALARNFPQLFLARASLGFGQAIDDPASTSLLADTYPASTRGKVFSVQQVSLFVGGGLGIGLGGLVGDTYGWQWAFAIVGMPGSLVGLLAFRLREPKRGEADGIDLPEPERLPIRELAKGAAGSLVSDLRMIFAIRTMRYVLVGFSVMLFSIAGISYWLAVYHERYSGFTEKEAAGVAAALLTVGGLIGTFAGGAIADRLYGVSPAARVTHVSNAILGCLVFFTASLAMPIVPVRLLLQFVAILSAATALPGLRASLMDVTPVQARGMTTSAFALTSTVLGTASAPIVVGGLSDLTGSLVTAYLIVTPPTIVGAIILRRARHTIVEDAAAIFQGLAERAESRPDGEPGDAPEITL
ncbi:MAG: MFS transporter [Actinomycetota bacterium]|nr:MFS transporter [Actinomycetota bacterium]